MKIKAPERDRQHWGSGIQPTGTSYPGATAAETFICAVINMGRDKCHLEEMTNNVPTQANER